MQYGSLPRESHLPSISNDNSAVFDVDTTFSDDDDERSDTPPPPPPPKYHAYFNKKQCIVVYK
jgi:hypothetical protein